MAGCIDLLPIRCSQQTLKLELVHIWNAPHPLSLQSHVLWVHTTPFPLWAIHPIVFWVKPSLFYSSLSHFVLPSLTTQKYISFSSSAQYDKQAELSVQEVHPDASGPFSCRSHLSNFIQLVSVSSTFISPVAAHGHLRRRRAWAPLAVSLWNSNQIKLTEHGTPTLPRRWQSRTHTHTHAQQTSVYVPGLARAHARASSTRPHTHKMQQTVRFHAQLLFKNYPSTAILLTWWLWTESELLRGPTIVAGLRLLQRFRWCTDEKISRGCTRGSANVLTALAGPASPPALWTAAPPMPLIKDLRNMPAARPELIVPPSTFMSALLQHRRRTARRERRIEEKIRFACCCEMILV